MMDEVDELRKQFKPLSGATVPEHTRSRITTMIDHYESNSGRNKKINRAEVFRTVGAMIAAVAVVYFVVLRVKSPTEFGATEGAGYTAPPVQTYMHVLVPYTVLLGTSLVVLLIAWGGRKGLFAIAYRDRRFEWLSGYVIGIRLYDSFRLQTYIAVLFTWVMFAIFVAPSSTSPWVGVLAFLLFCALCGSIRYFLFTIFALLAITVPAWWVATLPSGGFVDWYLIIVFNIAFFILTPGMILIPLRNALIRRLQK